MGNLTLQSPAFSNGEEIPKKYGYKHGNSSPPLKINGIPSNTQSFALIMDDPDAQAAVGKIWVHWVMYNIEPGTTVFSEGTVPSDITEGKNDFGEFGYGGPAPPDKRHTYIFKLYALDTKLDLSEGATKSKVEEKMQGHILEETKLEGTYAPS